jgi:DNA (cytosine-5)-methyltransferase 1
MENVPKLAEEAVFRRFLATLEKCGFHTSWQVVNCSEFGLPQSRKRLVLLASRLGPIRLVPPARRKRTVRQAIGSLPEIEAGEDYIRDALHTACALSPLNLKRIRASRPGGSWRDWPEHLMADCHRKDSGRSYSGVYARMTWDEPAPTITTQFYAFGSGRFGHPQQDRGLSLREGAILQGFPKGYAFVEPGEAINRRTIGRLIGNAVPVGLAKAIGRSIVAHVTRHIEARG